MSKMKELLASVAQEQCSDGTYNHLLAVLERRLLPLLEAGQAMREALAVHIERCHFEMLNYANEGILEPWDAALAAAKERQT
jgi:hypothetical protein